MEGLSLPGKECYAYKGQMYILDELKSKPQDGFHLLQIVTDKRLVADSGEASPTNDEVSVRDVCVSELSDIQVESKELADILLKMPSKKGIITSHLRLRVHLLCQIQLVMCLQLQQ